jgi:hypothetical protein
MAGNSSLPPASALMVSGASASSVIDLGSAASVGVTMPSAFTGSTLNAQVSPDGSTGWTPIYDSSNSLYTLTVSPSRAYGLFVGMVPPYRYVRLTTPSAQGGDRLFGITTRN